LFISLYLQKGGVQIVHTLVIDTPGGKQRMNYATTEGIFHIIQSNPSPLSGNRDVELAKGWGQIATPLSVPQKKRKQLNVKK